MQEVASITKGDEDFSNALKDPLYDRIRKALYSDNIPNGNGALELQDFKEEARASLDEGERDSSGSSGLQKDFKKDACLRVDEQTGDGNGALELQDPIKDAYVHLNQVTRTNVEDKKVHSEIEEINEDTSEMNESLDENYEKVRDSSANQLVDVPANNKKVVIRSEVRQALGTLEKAISIIRDFGYNLEIRSVSGNTTVKSLGVEEDGRKDSKSSETDRIHRSGIACTESPGKELSEATPYEHRNSSASHGSR